MNVKVIAIVLLLVSVAGGSFLIGRALLARDSAAEAQLAQADPCAFPTAVVPSPVGATPTKPEQTPVPTPCLPPPNPTLEALNRQLEAEAAKPKFVGELNGITFYGPGFDTAALLRQKSPKCTGFNGRAATEDQGRASPLFYTPTYLPAGASKPNIYVNACQDDVITVGFDYVVNGAEITIYRAASPAAFEGRFPTDRMRVTTIAGRPSVVAASPFPPSSPLYTVLMRDDKSLWIIQGKGIFEAELLKVAEEVR